MSTGETKFIPDEKQNDYFEYTERKNRYSCKKIKLASTERKRLNNQRYVEQLLPYSNASLQEIKAYLSDNKDG